MNMKSLKPDRAQGPASLSPLLLKECSAELAKSLYVLFMKPMNEVL